MSSVSIVFLIILDEHEQYVLIITPLYNLFIIIKLENIKYKYGVKHDSLIIIVVIILANNKLESTIKKQK